MNLYKRLLEIKTNLILYLPIIATGLMTLVSMIMIWIEPEFLNENGEIINYQVNDEVRYFSYGILLNLALIIVHKDIWKYTFSLQLILAFWGLIDVLSVVIVINLGIVKIEVISLLLLLIHIAINKDIVKSILGNKNIDQEKMEQDKQKSFDTPVLFFIEKFSDKTQEELNEIAQGDNYTHEAKEAAKRLMTEK